jgi:3',5'-cyclic-AMP phosphodiesterase
VSRELLRRTIRQCLLGLLAGATALAAASCRYGLDELFRREAPVDERVVDSSVPAPVPPLVPDPDNYVFVATADAHFLETADPPAAAGFAGLVSARGAAFVIVAGDLVDSGLPAEYARYAAWAASLGVPVYAAVGNHDLYNSGWSSFRTVVGRSYYSFAVGARTFYVLDSGNGTLGRVQLELLSAALAADPNRKVIVCHYPLYNGEDTQYYKLTNAAERAFLVDLFAQSGVELLLEGHSHATRHTPIGPMDEWLCSSLVGPAGGGRCVTVTVTGGAISSIVPETY